ncbi:hypothetical protein BH11BAC7_BH11BAC7_13810 [soil metagenome]
MATGLFLFVSSFLTAQNAAHRPAVNQPSTLNTTISTAPQATGFEPSQDVQMVACTDKVTYVDRHPQANLDFYVGGTDGWTILMMKYPGFTGQVTGGFASMRRVGANCPVRIVLYALDASGDPTGGYIAYVDATVNSATATEYGGNFTAAAAVTNGFAIGVLINSTNPTDSVFVMAHNDPDMEGYSYAYYSPTLYNIQSGLNDEIDILIRPQISYTAPTETISASSTTECAGVPINFSLLETNTPGFYSYAWASPTAPTYAWNFGDAGTSTLASPNHPYATAGSYTASGTKTNSGWISSCASAPATTTITITGISPSVSIAASATTVCNNQTVNFSATPVNGGPAPIYVWKKNNIQVGTTSAYTGSTWAYGDVMTCEMVSNASCASSTPSVSNQIVMTTQPLAVSSYSYVATHLSVAFTSTATNAVSWSWNFGDAGTSVSPNPVHNYAAAGTYTVDHSVTNSCGTTTVSSINITVTTNTNSNGGNTGINDKDLELSLNAFPNPVNDELNIQYAMNHPTDATIEILNTLGQVVSTELIPNASTGTAQISTANLSAGIYFVRFTAADKVSMKKIVRQ